MNLDGAIHVFDDRVAVPLELLKNLCAKARCTSGGDCNHSHIALAIFVDGMRDPVCKAAVRGQPVVAGTLGTTTHGSRSGPAKSLLHSAKIFAGNFRISVHQADEI